MSELRDIFGDPLEVLGYCRCGAPRTRPAGTQHGPTTHHRPECRWHGLILGEGHREALDWTEESQERDYQQMKARGDVR